jgi:hypothetical protein
MGDLDTLALAVLGVLTAPAALTVFVTVRRRRA